MNSTFGVIFISFVMNVFNVFVVYANRLDSLVYYDDDAISDLQLSSKDIFNLHHAFVIEDSKWENGEIYFKIDKRFTDYEIDKILEAMYDIESFSCVRFAAHDPSNGPDYVMIIKDYSGSGSSAHLGCIHRGEQNLLLSVSMINEHKTILHELLHTIGFGHHHQRSDRDKYIEIHLENTNLSDSDVSNFATKVRPDDRVTYLTPFDFNSVLLYDGYDGSMNGKPVITSKIEGKQVRAYGDRKRGLSKYDVILLNRFYDCHIVDKRKSKIFYEDEKAILFPKVVNYHEIQRAKDYFVEDEPDIRLKRLIFEILEILGNANKSTLPPDRSDKMDHYDGQYDENGPYLTDMKLGQNETHENEIVDELDDNDIDNEDLDDDEIDGRFESVGNKNSIDSGVDEQLYEEIRKDQTASINSDQTESNEEILSSTYKPFVSLPSTYKPFVTLSSTYKPLVEENQKEEFRSEDTNEEIENPYTNSGASKFSDNLRMPLF